MKNILYEKFDYQLYLKRIGSINNPLISKRCIGHTTYNYPLYDFIVGSGKKDLFLVGGIHGSEIVGVDFLSQLLENIDLLTNYDPNLVTLHIIPLLNPEGFDITTSTMANNEDESFSKEAYDYYLRYKYDLLTDAYLNYLKKISPISLFNRYGITTWLLKQSFSSLEWHQLCQNDLSDLLSFKSQIEETSEYTSYSILYKKIQEIVDSLIKNSNNIYLTSVAKRIGNFLTEEALNIHFGTRLIELTSVLNLPLPSIMMLPLTNFERKDLWGFKVTHPGR